MTTLALERTRRAPADPASFQARGRGVAAICTKLDKAVARAADAVDTTRLRQAFDAAMIAAADNPSPEVLARLEFTSKQLRRGRGSRLVDARNDLARDLATQLRKLAADVEKTTR
jgi:hypothetical protein